MTKLYELESVDATKRANVEGLNKAARNHVERTKDIDDEEFIRTKLVPVLNEMLKRKIVGYSDGDYCYKIVKKKEEEE